MRNALLLIIFLLIAIRIITHQAPYSNGDVIKITGKISREPTYGDDYQKIEIAGVRAYVPRYPELRYGDSISISGIVENDVINDAEVIDHKESNALLYKVRNRILDFFQRTLPEPHSSLISGVVLGSKSGMTEGFWETLQKSGTAHVVVASGMNVTLVGGFLLNSLVSILDRRKAIIGVIAGIWIYALMAGFDAPIVRAAIMGSVAFSAQAAGRLNNALRALLISGGVMLIINPVWITDVGFQLSFMATLSLIIFESKVSRLISFVPNIIRQDLSTSIAAQIGVAPLLIYYFESFNLLSPLINGVVLWTIPLVTIIGMIAGLISLLLPILGQVVLILTYPLTSWFVMIVGIVP